MEDALPIYDDIYSSAVVMARVGHLDRAKRQDIERITRIVRMSFTGAGVLKPKPKITRILLTGTYARRTWSRDGKTHPSLAYDLWVIVNDPLFANRRLWQQTETQIAAAMGGRCKVQLSFSAAQDVRLGKLNGEQAIISRLDTGITLFRAKRDAPQSRHRKGRAVWAKALARFDAAEAAFLPVAERFGAAESAWFARRSGGTSDEDDSTSIERRALDEATAEERHFGDALHQATMALLHTPAPDLAAIIRKVEIVSAVGDGDDHTSVSILSDLRWLASRLQLAGQSSRASE